jgi:hypothetical protein
MRNLRFNEVHGQGFFLSQLLNRLHEEISRCSGPNRSIQINTIMSSEAMTRSEHHFYSFCRTSQFSFLHQRCLHQMEINQILYFSRTRRRSACIYIKLENEGEVCYMPGGSTHAAPLYVTSLACPRRLQLTHNVHSSRRVLITVAAGDGMPSNTLALRSIQSDRKVSMISELATLLSCRERAWTASGHHCDRVLCGEGGSTPSCRRWQTAVHTAVAKGHCNDK